MWRYTNIVGRCIGLAAVLVLVIGCTSPLYTTTDLTQDVRQGIKDTIREKVNEMYPFSTIKPYDEQNRTTVEQFNQALDAVPVDTSLPDYEYKDRLRRAVSLLSDGHTRLEWGRYGYLPGMRLRYIEDGTDSGVYVERCVDRDSLRLQQGDRILSINGQSVDILLEDMKGYVYASTTESRQQQAANFVFAAAIVGTPGEEIRMPIPVRVERGGVLMDLDVVLKDGETKYVYSEPFYTTIPETDNRIGYIYIPTCRYVSDIDVLDRYINELMDTEAIVFDIRGNGGGNSAVVDYLVGRLSRFPRNTFTMNDTRSTDTQELSPFIRGRQYDGKVVILTDYLTFSAANYFAHRLRDATETGATGMWLVGEKTGGGAGSLTTVSLTPELSFSITENYITGVSGSLTENGTAVDVDVSSELTPESLRTDGYWTVPSWNTVDIEHDLPLIRALEVLGY